ncbi:MAG: hypothetical protein OCD00_17415 [Colwellia sp.]
MKQILLISALFSTSLMAENLHPGEDRAAIEAMLIEAASKGIYITRDCDKPIDMEKFKELSRIKAFSEGHNTIESVRWEKIKFKAHKQYGALKIKAPVGELCNQFKNEIKDSYQWLK